MRVRKEKGLFRVNSKAEKLESELRRLQKLTKLGLELSVKWLPNGDAKSPIDGRSISGQVSGKTILIYDKNDDDALPTLKHEFIEYAISNTIEKPYMDLINSLITNFQKQVYRNKEVLVEKLKEAI